ncbi:MAG: DUF134 domain-containing protein [Candidatus Omnitrophica bacterium]|nr:DUF134 domain-containing protein [Candidatus Omnitrophota bacterium]HOX55029.1 DUF134 domain-containing protein [Candidatus Omnitrophota bacterium]
MPRPFRLRKVCCRPTSNYFKPRGIPIEALQEVNLTMDELEAVRLADLEGLYQEDAAKKMNISRQTFGNIIVSAHKKIADSLVNSRALKIEGGVVKMIERNFVCYDCKHEWTSPHGAGRPDECPKCKSINIHRSVKDRGWSRHGGHGGGHRVCRRA